MQSALRTGVVLKGRVDRVPVASGPPMVVRLRRALGIDRSVRPVKALPGWPARAPDLDLIVVRESTEDVHAGFEHEVTDGVYEAVKITTEVACERIARWAFEVARKHGRKKVTIVHKSNIMKKSDGMFLATAQRVAEDFPDIACDEMIVDALCMGLVRWHGSFDVLLTANLFGDIVGDLVSGLAGGITAASTLSYGPKGAMVESPHGRAPELVGAGLANPIPLLQAALWICAM